jgi:hypothetical protein
MRRRALLAVGAAGVITLPVTLVAGPLYGALPSAVWPIGCLAWVYTAAIVLLGIGLHTFLGRWTTATLVALFVMLNFTSAGGVFAPELQPGFLDALHEFWIGSGLVEAGRTLAYFPGVGIGRQVLTLFVWLVAALAVVGLAALAERRRAALAAPDGDRPAHAAHADEPAVEEELEQSAVSA